MGMKRKLNIYISSTFIDLKKERNAIIEQVLHAGHIPISIDRFGPSKKFNPAINEKAIRECDVFVIIIGSRLGAMIQDNDGNEKSVIEFEYNFAQRLRKPIMVFQLSEVDYNKHRQLIPSDDREISYEKILRAFRKRVISIGIKSPTIVSFFYDEYGGIEGLKAKFQSGLEALVKNLEVENLSEPEFVAFALFGDKIKVVSLTPDGSYRFLDDTQNLYNIFYVSSETLGLQKAIEELESLINDKTVKEKDYQNFFERNPNFILNDHYKKAHPHIVLTKDDGELLIPDFVLEPIEQSFLSDLLELKLPSTQIFVLQKNRKRFSSAVFEASAQLREYSMFFDEKKNRDKFQERYGLLAYRPKMFVIIGRRCNVNPLDIRKMETDLPNLYLHTYDDIINRMKAKVDVMKKGKFKG